MEGMMKQDRDWRYEWLKRTVERMDEFEKRGEENITLTLLLAIFLVGCTPLHRADCLCAVKIPAPPAIVATPALTPTAPEPAAVTPDPAPVQAPVDTYTRVTARRNALKHKLRHNHLVTDVGIGIEGGLYVFANCPADHHKFVKFLDSIPTEFQGVPVKVQCNALR